MHVNKPQLQVEFAPTFEEQPMYDEWSWDQNPMNLTCISTAIPNATLTWWYEDREIGREIIDRNYKVLKIVLISSICRLIITDVQKLF